MEINDDIYSDDTAYSDSDDSDNSDSDFDLFYLRKLLPPTSGSCVRLFSPVSIDEEGIEGWYTQRRGPNNNSPQHGENTALMNIVRKVCQDNKTDILLTLPAFILIKDYLIYYSEVVINDFNWSRRKNFILCANPFLSSYFQSG
jgi:hypothetical protein